jgi:chromate reductase
MNSPEAYIQLTPSLVADDGSITDVTVADFLREFMLAFELFIDRVRTVLPVAV